MYGNGTQTRGLIEIRDTVRCTQLTCENPLTGEFRVLNQITEFMSLQEIADTIAGASPDEVTICHVENPRVELENHHYNAVHSGLVELGLAPSPALRHVDRIALRDHQAVRAPGQAGGLIPTIEWRKPSSVISN